MNIDFIQVNKDALDRVDEVAALTGQNRATLTGWLVRFWALRVSRINDEQNRASMRERASQVLAHQIETSLALEFGAEVAPAILSTLTDVGFFEPHKIERSQLRVCGLSRYFELADLRSKRRLAGSAGGKSSGKTRCLASKQNSSKREANAKQTEDLLEPSEVKSSEVKSTQNKKNKNNAHEHGDFRAQDDLPLTETESTHDAATGAAAAESSKPKRPRVRKAPVETVPFWRETIAGLGAIYERSKGSKYPFNSVPFEMRLLQNACKALDEIQNRRRLFLIWAYGLNTSEKFTQIGSIAKLCEKHQELALKDSVQKWVGEHWGEYEDLVAPQFRSPQPTPGGTP